MDVPAGPSWPGGCPIRFGGSELQAPWLNGWEGSPGGVQLVRAGTRLLQLGR